MRKIIPIIYLVLLYMMVLPFVVYIDLYEKLYSDTIAPIYFATIVAFGPISVAWAFYLYKKEDLKNLKFAMCLETFGLIPFYVMLSLFWLIVFALSNSSQSGETVLGLATLSLGYVFMSNAFYGLNYARAAKRNLFYKTAPFVFVLNVIALIILLIKEKLETKEDLKED